MDLREGCSNLLKEIQNPSGLLGLGHNRSGTGLKDRLVGREVLVCSWQPGSSGWREEKKTSFIGTTQHLICNRGIIIYVCIESKLLYKRTFVLCATCSSSRCDIIRNTSHMKNSNTIHANFRLYHLKWIKDSFLTSIASFMLFFISWIFCFFSLWRTKKNMFVLLVSFFFSTQKHKLPEFGFIKWSQEG